MLLGNCSLKFALAYGRWKGGTIDSFLRFRNTCVSLNSMHYMPIERAGLSMQYSVLDCLNPGITDSNPIQNMDVCSFSCFFY
jgi:hypothetical protein